jgi:hypothetical protein
MAHILPACGSVPTAQPMGVEAFGFPGLSAGELMRADVTALVIK